VCGRGEGREEKREKCLYEKINIDGGDG